MPQVDKEKRKEYNRRYYLKNKCEHNQLKTRCKECGGGSICEHNRVRTFCKECGGGSICEHKQERRYCKKCSLFQYLVQLQRTNIGKIMKRTDLEKTKPSIEYLGCSAEYFKNFIQSKMTPDMTFDNIHFDHIKPISRFNLSNIDELFECCHYTNFQPLLAVDNLEKGNKWSDDDELFWNENIKGKEYLQIYLPN